MISVDYVRTMAAYNRWQNSNLYAAADNLTNSERRADRGAFFGSIFGTLNHLAWGDGMWLGRFEKTAPPPSSSISDSTELCADWAALSDRRRQLDQNIIAWAAGLPPKTLGEDLTWIPAATNQENTQPLWLLITHFFNHQTHHRGQVHAMLTAAGAKPKDTDLIFLPPG